MRETADPFALPVRRVAFSGPAAYRVVGLAQMPDHAKAALAEALLAELKVHSLPTSAATQTRRKPQ